MPEITFAKEYDDGTMEAIIHFQNKREYEAFRPIIQERDMEGMMVNIDECAEHLFKEARRLGYRIKGKLSLERLKGDE